MHRFRAPDPDRVGRRIDGDVGTHFDHDVDDPLLRVNAGHVEILQSNVRAGCDGGCHHGHRGNTEVAGNGQACGFVGLSAGHHIDVGGAAGIIFDPERVEHLQRHVDVRLLPQRIRDPDGHPVAAERRADQDPRKPLRDEAGDLRFSAGEAAALDNDGRLSVALGRMTTDAQRGQTVQQRLDGSSAQRLVAREHRPPRSCRRDPQQELERGARVINIDHVPGGMIFTAVNDTGVVGELDGRTERRDVLRGRSHLADEGPGRVHDRGPPVGQRSHDHRPREMVLRRNDTDRPVQSGAGSGFDVHRGLPACCYMAANVAPAERRWLSVPRHGP